MQDCRLNGFYRGTVLRHLNSGRLKVFVHGVYADEWKDKPDFLPPAEQAAPMFGGGNFGNGCFSYPNIGSTVWCFFANGDQNQPIVFGQTLGSDMAGQKYAEVADELDERTGSVPSAIHMVRCGRSKVKLYEGGQVEVQVAAAGGGGGKVVIGKDGDVFVDTTGTFQVSAKDVKFIVTDKLELNANDVALAATKQVFAQGATVTANATEGKVLLTSPENLVGKTF